MSCSPTGSGFGVISNNRDIAVVNGTIRGMGGSGIVFSNPPNRVERVHAVSNGGSGISAKGLVTGNIATNNGGSGINLGSGLATGNEVSGNGGDGIFSLAVVTVTGNTANRNDGDGLSVSGGSIRGNTAFANGGNGITVSGAASVVGNTLVLNSGFQLDLSSDAGYSNNVIDEIVSDTVSGGVQMGQNVCNGNTSCP